jgi:hypothetical protein
MVTCGCGKSIEKLPSWLQGTKVDFVCNNCPNRQTKNIALISQELDQKPSAKMDDDDELELEDIAEEDLDV